MQQSLEEWAQAALNGVGSDTEFEVTDPAEGRFVLAYRPSSETYPYSIIWVTHWWPQTAKPEQFWRDIGNWRHAITLRELAERITGDTIAPGDVFGETAIPLKEKASP